MVKLYGTTKYGLTAHDLLKRIWKGLKESVIVNHFHASQ